MKDKYNKIIKDVYKDSFNIKCEMLFLVSKLKINKSNIYQIPVSNYLVKEYNIFKYLINYKIRGCEDIIFCNFLIKLSRSYLKVLYYKFLDMYDLQFNRIYDNYESISRKRKYKKIKYIKKYSKELIDKYNYVNSLYKRIFKNINILIRINDLMLLKYRKINTINILNIYSEEVIKILF